MCGLSKMNNFVFYFLIAGVVLQVKCWRPFTFHFNSIQCVKKSPLTAFFNCSLTKIKKNQEGLCFNLKFGTVIQKPRLDLAIFTTRQNQPDFLMVNLTDIDGCQFLENKGGFNILQILRKEFAKYSDLPDKCPLEKDTEIHVNNLVLDVDNFPPYVPETMFHVHLLMLEKDQPMLDLFINGSVESKQRANKKIKV